MNNQKPKIGRPTGFNAEYRRAALDRVGWPYEDTKEGIWEAWIELASSLYRDFESCICVSEITWISPPIILKDIRSAGIKIKGRGGRNKKQIVLSNGMLLKDVAKMTGMSYHTIYAHIIGKGWNVEDVIRGDYKYSHRKKEGNYE